LHKSLRTEVVKGPSVPCSFGIRLIIIVPSFLNEKRVALIFCTTLR
jgi:hypothetical protein